MEGVTEVFREYQLIRLRCSRCSTASMSSMLAILDGKHIEYTYNTRRQVYRVCCYEPRLFIKDAAGPPQDTRAAVESLTHCSTWAAVEPLTHYSTWVIVKSLTYCSTWIAVESTNTHLYKYIRCIYQEVSYSITVYYLIIWS